MGDQIKNEMGQACSTYGGEEWRIQDFGWGNLREKDHLEDPGVNGRKILRRIFRKWDVGVWTGSMWLGNRRLAFENAVMNLPVP